MFKSCSTLGIDVVKLKTQITSFSSFFFFTAQLNSSEPVNYMVLLNPESDGAILRPAGQDRQLTVMGLEPFTAYHIRVQACQTGKYSMVLTSV